jgi:uncharacterized protein YPO0396
MQVDLTDEEVECLIASVHHAQDTYANAADSLSQTANDIEDIELRKQMDKRVDVLDVVLKKLGDTWKPAKDFKAPDTIEGLDKEDE